jgi:hypothetical protein
MSLAVEVAVPAWAGPDRDRDASGGRSAPAKQPLPEAAMEARAKVETRARAAGRQPVSSKAFRAGSSAPGVGLVVVGVAVVGPAQEP